MELIPHAPCVLQLAVLQSNPGLLKSNPDERCKKICQSNIKQKLYLTLRLHRIRKTYAGILRLLQLALPLP
jgi:hypothetical protein